MTQDNNLYQTVTNLRNNIRNRLKNNQNYEKYKPFIAGGIAGYTEVTLTHPIDIFKTSIQNNQKCAIRDMLSYRGYIARVTGVIPMRTLYWGVHSHCRPYIEPFCDKYHDNKYRDYYLNFYSGWCAGMVQTLVDCPIESIKVKKITSVGNYKDIYNFRSLYHGFGPTLFRNALYAGVFFSYINGDFIGNKFIDGAVGGILASVSSHPLDYIKTCTQSYDKRKTVIEVIKETKPLKYYKGVIPRSMVSVGIMGIGNLVTSFIL